MLEINNLHKWYGNYHALNNINITIKKGDIYGLLGPNGAGKTTLIRTVTQITAPDEGEIYFNGEKLHPKHISQIGYLPEERGLYKKMQVGRQALYLARLKGMSKADAMKELKYWFEKFEITSWWNKKVEELSKGMQQKIQFIISMVHKPDLMILDEPFSGLDPINSELIANEIKELKNKGVSIIFSTHNMASVEEICDEIALVNKGEIILNGKVNEIKNNYSKKEYEIGFEGNLIGFTNALWTDYELVDSQPKGATILARVKAKKSDNSNHLLQSVMSSVKIHSFKEILPSMHEIFIEKVKEQKHDE